MCEPQDDRLVELVLYAYEHAVYTLRHFLPSGGANATVVFISDEIGPECERLAGGRRVAWPPDVFFAQLFPREGQGVADGDEEAVCKG